MTALKDKIYQRIQEVLHPEYLEVIDESLEHFGHKGFSNDGSHFFVKVRDPSLSTLNKVQQHQKIYNILAAWIPKPIHALRIEILS